jgi:hypothetical protein
MESRPVPRADWERRLTGVGETHIGSRFTYNEQDLDRQDHSYDTQRLQCAYGVMRGNFMENCIK